MFCPMCGAPNEDDAAYCANCGAALQEEARAIEPESDVAAATLVEIPSQIEPAQQAAEEAPVEPISPQALPAPALPEVEAEPARRPPPAVAPAAVPTSGLAIASLVLGVGGLTVLPLLGSIAAIILGYMARNDIRRRPDEVTGDGVALAGIVMGWIPVAAAVVIAVLALLGVVTSVCGVGLCGLTGGSWQ